MEKGKYLESVDLIDVFAEDDILLSSSPRDFLSSGPASSNGETSVLSLHGSFDNTNTSGSDSSKIEVNISPVEVRDKPSGQSDPFSPPSDSSETVNCARGNDLRKSLAWDSAFFTGEGVLDPEELADVNSSFGNIQKQSMPKIPQVARTKSQRIVLPSKKGALKPPRSGSRIPILPASRQSSVNPKSTQTRDLPVNSQTVIARRKLSVVNALPPFRYSKDTCQVPEQRRKCDGGKVKPELISPSSSVESFGSEFSSSSISLVKRPAASAQILRTNSFSLTQLTTKEVKPSGLRLPSPKVGYFEKGKPQPRGGDRNPRKNQPI